MPKALFLSHLQRELSLRTLFLEAKMLHMLEIKAVEFAVERSAIFN